MIIIGVFLSTLALFGSPAIAFLFVLYYFISD